MKQGKKNFPNGLTIVYAYPDDRSPNISSLVQLHFGFKDRYGQRSDATFSDALTAIDGIKQDIHELKIWIKENGMPRYFSGGTSTQLLIRILREAGMNPTQSTEGGSYSFRFDTEGQTADEVFNRIDTAIESVSNYAKDLEGRRKRRLE